MEERPNILGIIYFYIHIFIRLLLSNFAIRAIYERISPPERNIVVLLERTVKCSVTSSVFRPIGMETHFRVVYQNNEIPAVNRLGGKPRGTRLTYL